MSDPYYTHRKYLKKELSLLDSKNKLKILEFGVGEGSSSIFNEFALNNKNIKIEAFETDKAWLDETKEKYELDNYKFTHIDNWNDFLIEKNFQENYDLIFVDQSPWEARVKTLDILINKSSVTILHDYDYFNKGFIEELDSSSFAASSSSFILFSYCFLVQVFTCLTVESDVLVAILNFCTPPIFTDRILL